MRAVVKALPKDGGLELQERPQPQPGPGEVLVRVAASAICGSDVHIYRWLGWIQDFGLRLPAVLGHEFSGYVEELGAGVRGLTPGDLVAGETHLPCGECPRCRVGEAHICQFGRIFGMHTPGSFAEYTVIPAACAIKVEGLSPQVAAILEPLGGPLRCVREVDAAGQTLAVGGCGPIGLFGIGWARALGAARIIASDVSDYRLEMARSMGADVALNPRRENVVERVRELTGGAGADAVIDFSGAPAAILQGFELLRRGGRYALFGLPEEPLSLDVSRHIVLKEARVVGIHGREMYDTWYRMLDLLRSGVFDPSPVITHRLPLEQFEQGFQLCLEGSCGKVLLEPDLSP